MQIINKIKLGHSVLACLAGVEGIEPSSGVLETLILPMNYTPKARLSIAYSIFLVNYYSYSSSSSSRPYIA